MTRCLIVQVSNCPSVQLSRCLIVRVSNCLVSNCPVSNCPVSNCPGFKLYARKDSHAVEGGHGVGLEEAVGLKHDVVAWQLRALVHVDPVLVLDARLERWQRSHWVKVKYRSSSRIMMVTKQMSDWAKVKDRNSSSNIKWQVQVPFKTLQKG